jgi:hypothetical protein
VEKRMAIFFRVVGVSIGLILLNSVPPDANAEETISDIMIKSEIDEVVSGFQASMSLLSKEATITSCSIAVNYFATGAGRDYSTGAFCEVRIGDISRSILMCDDKMVGKFTAKIINYIYTIDRNEVVHFVRENCPPGE